MQKVDAKRLAARVVELGKIVQAQEVKCAEIIRRADEAIKRAHIAIEVSERKLQQFRELRRILPNRP
jgi:hypothetical protein